MPIIGIPVYTPQVRRIQSCHVDAPGQSVSAFDCKQPRPTSLCEVALDGQPTRSRLASPSLKSPFGRGSPGQIVKGLSGRSPHLPDGKSETSVRFQKEIKVLCSSTNSHHPSFDAPIRAQWRASTGNLAALIYDMALLTASQRVDSHTRSAISSSPTEMK